MARPAAAFARGNGCSVTRSGQVVFGVIASKVFQSGDIGDGCSGTWLNTSSLRGRAAGGGHPCRGARWGSVSEGSATRNVSRILIPSCMSCDHRRLQPARVAAAVDHRVGDRQLVTLGEVEAEGVGFGGQRRDGEQGAQRGEEFARTPVSRSGSPRFGFALDRGQAPSPSPYLSPRKAGRGAASAAEFGQKRRTKVRTGVRAPSPRALRGER